MINYVLLYVRNIQYIVYTVCPNLLYVFNKWSEFTSQVIRVYFTSGPSLLHKWSEFTSKVVRVQIKCLPI